MREISDLKTGIEHKIRAGLFEEALSLIDSASEVSSGSQFMLNLYKPDIYRRMRKYSDAFEIVSQLEKQMNTDQIDRYLQIQFMIEKAYVLWYIVDYDKSNITLQSAKEHLAHMEEGGKKQMLLADINLVEGNLAARFGLLENAATAYLRSIRIRQNIGTQRYLATLYSNLGSVFQLTGELEKALNYHHKAHEQGVMDNNPRETAIGKYNIAIVKHSMGDSTVLNEIKAVVSEIRAIETSRYTAENFMDLILIGLQDNIPELVDEYMKELKEIAIETNDPMCDLYLKFSKASILRASNRLEDIVEGSILMRVLSGNTTDFGLRVRAIKYYCDYLIDEFSLYSQDEVLVEIENYINELYYIGKSRNLRLLILQSLLLKANLDLIRNNTAQAMENLREIEKFPELYDRNNIMNVRNEKKKLQNRIFQLNDHSEEVKDQVVNDYLEDVRNLLRD